MQRVVATRGPMRLPFLIQHTTQDLAALLRLPDLVGILVLVELEKFLVGFERRLGLVKFIVAESADKPLARSRCFHLGDQVLHRERGRKVSAEIVRGSEVLPIDEIVFVELQRSFQLFFSRGKIALLKIDAAQSAVKFRVVGRERDSFAKRDDGIVPFFLGNLDVGAGAERIHGGRLSGVRAVEFCERGIVLLLLDQKMDRSRLRARRVRLNGEIVAISGRSFRFFLRVKCLRQAEQRLRGFRLEFERGAEFCFGVGIALQADVEIAEVNDGFDVARVETERGFVRSRRRRECRRNAPARGRGESAVGFGRGEDRRLGEAARQRRRDFFR